MKNRIIVCFISLLGLASCSDSNEELKETEFSDGQASSSGSLVATLIDGLYDKWRAGDTILLLHDGQTAFAEAQESGNISSFTMVCQELSRTAIPYTASIRQALWYLSTMRALPYPFLPFRRQRIADLMKLRLCQ